MEDKLMPTGVWITTKIPNEIKAAEVMAGYLGNRPKPEVVREEQPDRTWTVTATYLDDGEEHTEEFEG